VVVRDKLPNQHNWFHGLPWRIRFKQSRLYISVLPVLVLGLCIGFVGSLLGIGGGFILVPALVYILRMPGNMVIGTSLLQVVAMMAATTVLHAVNSQSVDILLAFCLMVGGTVGAAVVAGGVVGATLPSGVVAGGPTRSVVVVVVTAGNGSLPASRIDRPDPHPATNATVTSGVSSGVRHRL